MLRSYQTEGVGRLKEMLTSRRSAYLADEMGLGKTLQAITLAKELACNRVIVVCPASLRLNWQREFKRWSNYNVAVVQSSKEIPSKWPEYPAAIVCSYELAKHMEESACELLICDEAHALKTATSKRTRAVLGGLWPYAKYHLLMSGTPCPNGIIDGFNLWSVLEPAGFPNKYQFGFRYTHARKNYFSRGYDFKGGKNLNELRAKVAPFTVRRKKEDVLRDLPEKIYSQIPIGIEAPKRFVFAPEVAALVAEGEAARFALSYATARRGLGICKAPQCAEYINEVATAKERLVVFAYHTDVINILADVLGQTHRVEVLDGNTGMGRRDRIVAEFQSAQSPMILIAQMQAAGVGINLTAADTCIFVEPDWVPATMAQAIDRLHRIGQLHSVHVQYLIAAGTMDEDIISSLDSKIKAITGAIDGESC